MELCNGERCLHKDTLIVVCYALFCICFGLTVAFVVVFLDKRRERKAKACAFPDDPTKGKPSDHSVPVCVPHTDRYSRPERSFKTVKYRPMPESSIRKFGEWIVSEGLRGDLTPTGQTKVFKDKIQEI